MFVVKQIRQVPILIWHAPCRTSVSEWSSQECVCRGSMQALIRLRKDCKILMINLTHIWKKCKKSWLQSRLLISLFKRTAMSSRYQRWPLHRNCRILMFLLSLDISDGHLVCIDLSIHIPITSQLMNHITKLASIYCHWTSGCIAIGYLILMMLQLTTICHTDWNWLYVYSASWKIWNKSMAHSFVVWAKSWPYKLCHRTAQTSFLPSTNSCLREKASGDTWQTNCEICWEVGQLLLKRERLLCLVSSR